MELRNMLNDMDFSKVDIPETKARRRREDTEPLTDASGSGSDESIPF